MNRADQAGADIPGLEGVVERLCRDGGRILVVDDLTDFERQRDSAAEEEIYHEHIENEEQLTWRPPLRPDGNGGHAPTRQRLSVTDGGHRRIAEWAESDPEQLRGYDLIVVNANLDQRGPVQLLQIARSINSIEVARRESPDAYIIHYLPGMDPRQEAALQKFTAFTAHREYETRTFDPGTFPTLMHLLAHEFDGRSAGERRGARSISHEQHDYKNRMWQERFLPLIDRSLQAGNTQTLTDYQFLILSGRHRAALGDYDPNAREKVKVRASEYALDEEDLLRSAAIFIDNEWDAERHRGALGDGLGTLRRVRAQLDAAGVDIPIIYQSGHEANHFSPVERQELARLGAVLAAKDIFPKVCKGEERYGREAAIGEAVKSDPRLARYLTELVSFDGRSLFRDGLFVSASRIVDAGVDGAIDGAADRVRHDEERQARFAGAGLAPSPLLHRLYVLSLFHAGLDGLVGDARLAPISTDFHPFERIIEGGAEPGWDGLRGVADGAYDRILDGLRPVYETIVAEQRAEYGRRQEEGSLVLTHNDTKWDNWLGRAGEEVLADFGSAQPGMEYKDVAKALLDPVHGLDALLDPERADALIDGYRQLRDGEGRPVGMDRKEFQAKVYGALVTESLRIAASKVGLRGFEEMVPKLLEVAALYGAELSERKRAAEEPRAGERVA